ncbi:MAG: chemotaxis-specific protein-glutamate methyltransferase CheB [Bdellovibrio sp.]
MKKIKVIIADASVVYRSQIKAALQDISWLEVIAVASNGKLALERYSAHPADLLILGMEMPEMNGLQTLEELKKRGELCKVMIFSSPTKDDMDAALEAMHLGADDFITKPAGSEEFHDQDMNPTEKIRLVLEPRINCLFPQHSETHVQPLTNPEHFCPSSFPRISWDLFKPKIVVIGSSTGGPTVLENIFSSLKTPVHCPIVIVQHMPPVFTKTFAERLEKLSGIKTFEANHGMLLEDNCIYVAPGDYHLRLNEKYGSVHIALDQGPLINSVRPAVDPLFSSAASIYKDHCLGILLTGMGTDGKEGAVSIKQNRGAVVIQEEKSCVVFGMPGAVFASGAYDRIATPKDIVDILREKTSLLGTVA